MFACQELTVRELNLLVKKHGGKKGVLRFLRQELSKSNRSWSEKAGVISFSVTSDGTSGRKWIKRLERKGFKVGVHAKSALLSRQFKPTKGVTTNIKILKGEMWSDVRRTTKNILATAVKRKLTRPNAEVACLIREMFSDIQLEAMGLRWVIVMHRFIKDVDGGPSALDICSRDDGSWLRANYIGSGRKWDRERGFAFAT